jgi:AcrR family transcriptional regulator
MAAMTEPKIFDKCEALYATALREFAEKSFEAASLNRIISTAGVSKGSFYYHFANKEDLFFYLIDMAVQKRLDTVSVEMARIADVDKGFDVFALLKQQAKVGVVFAQKHPELVQFAVRVARERGPIAEKLMTRLGGRTVEILRPLIDEAVTKAQIRSDLGNSFVTVMLSHLLLNFDLLFVGPNSNPAEIEVELDRYFEFIQYGLAGSRTAALH